MKRPARLDQSPVLRGSSSVPQRKYRDPAVPVSSSFYAPKPFTLEQVADVRAGTRLRAEGSVGEAEVHVRPLGEPELEEVRREARQRVDAKLEAEDLLGLSEAMRLEWQDRMFQRLVLTRAVVRTFGPDVPPTPFFGSVADVEALDASSVSTLFAIWTHVQLRACPAGDTDDAEALAHALAAPSGLERVRATHALELCSYYGVNTARTLTDAQVLAFLRLLEAPN
ncbi:MAG: hypothetical protein KC619_24140 [Myxococcales bacterium]|nr:hypothetical protein [Myxococcales bacterium]